jgi:hypothetical protein
MRKKKQRQLQTEDYGFHLSEEPDKQKGEDSDKTADDQDGPDK